MATIRQRGKKWQAMVRKAGAQPVTRTFQTKAMAERWARRTEADIEDGTSRGGTMATGTVTELLDRYEREVGAVKPFGRSKLSSIGLLRDGLGRERVRDLDAGRIIAFAQKRHRAGAGPVTIGIDLSYLGTVLRTARALWRIKVSDEPVRQAREALEMIGLTARSGERERRPTKAEIARLCDHWRHNPRQTIPMADLVEFAIATGMRQEEICRIRWADLDRAAFTVVVRDRKHPRAKKGNDEAVPLLAVNGYDAFAIIERQPPGSACIFPYRPGSVSAAFTRGCQALGIDGLRFHDMRHEAASRFFEAGLAIEQVAICTGHKDWRTLKRYTQLRPAGIIARFRPPAAPGSPR